MTGRPHQALNVVAALFLVLCAGGCASEFDKAWNAAAERPAEVNDITGRWKGRWKSEASGHGGGLRAVVTRADQQTYQAHFHATYAAVFQFEYKMTMNAQPQGATAPATDGLRFTGEADLGGAAGGLYQYDGHVTADRFHCTYKSKNDRGYFEMTRPDRPKGTRVATSPGAGSAVGAAAQHPPPPSRAPRP